MRRVALVLIALAVSLTVTLYLARHREAQPLTPELRSQLGGAYVDLAVGTTHYALSGPAHGRLVVLVHGGTIPMWTWDAQVPALTAAGYRVLRYDQLGRGLSDRPAGPYDRALYQRQLIELLDALRVDEPLHLVGLSFGSTVSATFAQAHPQRVDRLVLLSPIVHYAEGKLLFDLAKVPGVGEWYTRVIAVPGSIERAKALFPPDRAAALTALFEQQTRLDGYAAALLSFARSDALQDYRPALADLDPRRALVLIGTEDHETPPAHKDFLRQTFGAGYVEIDGGGHGMHVARASAINSKILSFLGSDGDAGPESE